MASSVALLGMAPAVAHAGYFLTRTQAQSFMRDHLHQEGYTNTGVFCRPQGLKRAQPGYVYHRWTCFWIVGYERGVGYDCEGQSVIMGSRRPGWYYARDDDAHGPACIQYH